MVEAQEEQIKTVVAYLRAPETTMAALDIILSLSADKAQRDLFIETDLHKQLLRLLPEKNFSEKVLSCMINYGQDKEHLSKMIQANCSSRLFDFLKEHITLDISRDQTNENKKDVKLLKGENVYEIAPPTQNFNIHNAISLSMMFYNNLTQDEEGRKHFMNIDSPKLKGFVLENLVGMGIFFENNEIFDFIYNVLANISTV
jgi:hypothetical protein